jgi:hypothetical protein
VPLGVLLLGALLYIVVEQAESDNRAVPSVGAADGGGIHDRNGAILSIRHSTFTGNQTLGGPGGNGLGGGLYINRNTACVEKARVTGNSATGGSGGPGGQDGQGIGGGVHIVAGSTVGLPHTQVTNNIASTSHDDIFGDFSEDCPF